MDFNKLKSIAAVKSAELKKAAEKQAVTIKSALSLADMLAMQVKVREAKEKGVNVDLATVAKGVISKSKSFEKFTAKAAVINTPGDNFIGTLVDKIIETGDLDKLIQEQFSEMMIEQLITKLVFTQLGVKTIAIPKGSLTVPILRSVNGGITFAGGYVGELGEIPTDDMEVKSFKLQARKMGVIVPMSKESILNSVGNTEAMVMAQITQSFVRIMENAFFFGTGSAPQVDTSNAPKGLVSVLGTAQVAGTAATAGKLTVMTAANFNRLEAMKMKTGLMRANVDVAAPSLKWAMSVNYFEALAVEKVGTNDSNWLNPEVHGANPVFLGYPLIVSQALRSGSKDYCFLGQWDQAIMGEQYNVTVTASDTASVKIGSATYSGFQNDMIFIKATTAHDFAFPIPEVFIGIVTA